MASKPFPAASSLPALRLAPLILCVFTCACLSIYDLISPSIIVQRNLVLRYFLLRCPSRWGEIPHHWQQRSSNFFLNFSLVVPKGHCWGRSCWDGTARAYRIALVKTVARGTGELISKSCLATSHVKLLRNKEAPGAPAPFWVTKTLLVAGSSHVFIGLALPRGLINAARAGGCGASLEPG